MNTQVPFWHLAGDIDPLAALVVLWVVVAMTMIAMACYRYIRVLRLVGELQSAPDDWQQQWKSLCRRSGLQHGTGRR